MSKEMRKKIILFIILVFTISSAHDCNKRSQSGKLKGKLVIMELCSNYVVQVVDGEVDTSRLVNGWRDEKRKMVYDKVFTVANRCDFPATDLKEGDEFEFMFDGNPAPQNCMVCMAYYPVPPKANSIKTLRSK